MANFNDTILALAPDVYWRMDDPDLSVQCTDYSGNARHGLYETVANLTPSQGSLVPNDPAAVSVGVSSVTAPAALASAHDDYTVSADTWWNTTHPSISVCIARAAPVTDNNQYIFARIALVSLGGSDIYYLHFTPGGNLRIVYKISDCVEHGILATTGVNYADGVPHIVTVIIDPGGRGLELWVDCVLVAFNEFANPICSSQDVQQAFHVGQFPVAYDSLNGDMSHFVFGKRVWAAAEIEGLHDSWGCGGGSGGCVFPSTLLPPAIICTKTCPVGLPPTGDSVTCIPKP